MSASVYVTPKANSFTVIKAFCSCMLCRILASSSNCLSNLLTLLPEINKTSTIWIRDYNHCILTIDSVMTEISKENLDEVGFEPTSSGFQVQCSTIWAIQLYIMGPIPVYQYLCYGCYGKRQGRDLNAASILRRIHTQLCVLRPIDHVANLPNNALCTGRARAQMLPFSYQICTLVLPTIHHVD